MKTRSRYRHDRKPTYSKAPSRRPGQMWLHKESGHKYVLVSFEFNPNRHASQMRTWIILNISPEGRIMVAQQSADSWENGDSIECVYNPSSQDL